MARGSNHRQHLNVPADRMAKLEIVCWDDPIMRGTPQDPDGRFYIDGLVPLDVALEVNSFCVHAGSHLDMFGLDDLEPAEIANDTGRVLIDGLVPLVIAQKAQAICDAHNASLSSIGA
ncbi:hypothetical protein QWE_05858 [Agrobacterium albertimagni AOL15]|uniref:Uncharacterized protein n=1 Tax=Agrobacterium albertimagni AOL15 TaxID=1156935 RepID=K2QYC7_9HYPH|nr:hypothetical protein [Agrobacterium albertimagni]EKF60567.1 hypothetical protein QWE_05858 [Agrobacterium albertimagni AOL15]